MRKNCAKRCFAIGRIMYYNIEYEEVLFATLITKGGGKNMDTNTRPETMQRITTPTLAETFISQKIAEIRDQVGEKKVLLALSGGVDSSVVAALLIKAIGKQLVCVHVNHGLMRKGESEDVIRVFREGMDANLVYGCHRPVFRFAGRCF